MTFTCPFCEMTSSSPQDAAQAYCGNCHVFVRDIEGASPAMRRTMAGLLRSLAARREAEGRERLQAGDKLRREATIWERAARMWPG